MASKRLGELPRIERGRPGRPGPWLLQGGQQQWGAAAAEGAAVISTRLRVPFELVLRLSPRNVPGIDSCTCCSCTCCRQAVRVAVYPIIADYEAVQLCVGAETMQNCANRRPTGLPLVKENHGRGSSHLCHWRPKTLHGQELACQSVRPLRKRRIPEAKAVAIRNAGRW